MGLLPLGSDGPPLTENKNIFYKIWWRHCWPQNAWTNHRLPRLPFGNRSIFREISNGDFACSRPEPLPHRAPGTGDNYAIRCSHMTPHSTLLVLSRNYRKNKLVLQKKEKSQLIFLLDHPKALARYVYW